MTDDAMERAKEVVAEFVSDGEGWIDTELASLRNVVATAITAAVEAERAAWQMKIHNLCPEELCNEGMLYDDQNHAMGACEWPGHIVAGHT